MKNFYIKSILFLFSIQAFSQTIVWENTIGGNQIEWNNVIEKTSDGNAIIGGYSYSNISGDKTENSKGAGDYWLVKLNVTTGNLIWQKTIGGNNFDHLTSCFETQDGGYILGGYSSSNISGDKTEDSEGLDDFWILKLDINRNIIWQKTFGGNLVDRLTSMISTDDGGYLIAGNSNSGIFGNKTTPNFGLIDIWVIKISSIGTIEWQKSYGGADSDFDGKLLKTNHNSYLLSCSSHSDISGNKTSNNKGLGDLWILNLDLNGNIIWQKSFGGSNGDYSNALLETNDGNYLIQADSSSDISGDKTQVCNGIVDVWLLKLNWTDGTIIWQKTIGGSSTDWSSDIKKTYDDNYIMLAMSASEISGQKTEANKGDRDYWLIKIDSNGEVLWDKTIGGDLADQPQSLIEISPEQYICSGWSKSNISGDKSEGNIGIQDNWVVKITNCDSSNLINTIQTVCVNQSLNLYAPIGNTYTWSGPNSFISYDQNPTILNVSNLNNGLYSCTIRNDGVCDIIKNINVNIQTTSSPSGESNQSFCIPSNATLGNIIINGNNIKWYDNGNIVLPYSTPLIDGNTYYATQTINGCESLNKFAVTINSNNILNATNFQYKLCGGLSNGTETINLTNYNTNLITATGNDFSYYTTLTGAENQVTVDKITNPTSYNLTIGNSIIYVRIDSPNTCHQVVELDLTLYSKPFLTLNDIMPICEGASITIYAGNGYDDYLWSTGETTPSITVLQPGSYSITVSENHGTLVCSTTKNFTVVNSNIGTISQIISSDWTDNENTISVLLNSNSEGNYEYSLDGITYQDSPVFTGLESGEYTVFVNDKNGCGEVTGEVYLLMYPKFFTPNNDGYNDFWKIKFSENEPNLIIKIFDRYGKFLKQLSTTSEGWDGTYLGNQLPATDYWFTVTRENGKEFRGHFSLKR